MDGTALHFNSSAEFGCAHGVQGISLFACLVATYMVDFMRALFRYYYASLIT